MSWVFTISEGGDNKEAVKQAIAASVEETVRPAGRLQSSARVVRSVEEEAGEVVGIMLLTDFIGTLMGLSLIRWVMGNISVK